MRHIFILDSVLVFVLFKLLFSAWMLVSTFHLMQPSSSGCFVKLWKLYRTSNLYLTHRGSLLSFYQPWLCVSIVFCQVNARCSSYAIKCHFYSTFLPITSVECPLRKNSCRVRENFSWQIWRNLIHLFYGISISLLSYSKSWNCKFIEYNWNQVAFFF